MNNNNCPVPKNQRPLNEYFDIKNSWLLSWPMKTNFYNNLIITWFIILPLSLIICYGSIQLRNNPINLFIISSLSAIIFPIALQLRLWLSWSYIFNRLISDKIEYEESGWYDGQIWKKPNDWRMKDYLIGQYEVKPVLTSIKKAILNSIIFSMVIMTMFFYINL